MALTGKVAIVTGGASGIGAAIVQRYRADGAVVYAADRAVGDGPGTVAIDVTDAGSVDRAFDWVLRREGRLDVCVANAGISPSSAPVAELEERVWREVLDVNLTGAFLTLRAAARRIGSGALIATSSVGGLRGGAGGSAYVAAKFGLRGLVESMALELAPHVTVNLVAPGDTATPLHDRVCERVAGDARSAATVSAAMAEAIPLGRVADPAEIAAAYAFLASDDARYVTGTVLVADGGAVLARPARARAPAPPGG